MARESREVWAKRVARWRESGLTAKEFAAETGLSVSSLQHWSWRLGAGKDKQRSAPLNFVELAATTAPCPKEVVPALSVFEVVLAKGTTLRVPSDFDPEALRRLIDTLAR